MSGLRGRAGRSRIQGGRGRGGSSSRNTADFARPVSQRTTFANAEFSQVKFQSKSKKSVEESTRNFAFEKEDKPPDLEPFKKHMISPGSFVEYHVAVFENEEELSKKLIKYLPVMDDDTTPDTLRRLLRCEYLPEKRPWPNHMEEIRSITTQNLQSRFEESSFDRAKCNLIRYEKDIFTFTGNDPEFYCIFGDSRTILFQSRKSRKTRFRIVTFSGSLLILSGNIFKDWDITIPIEYHDRDSTVLINF
ncbi:Oidioi.mRNA.OKI2018_I69.chr1.g2580.t1.cds [Oikopleura dioica]|uniref:Oidioi.mRNA.OKI2018_I69.chr1.g2580.t1.cds n=1 Tax=Oikopleura dioica TaxID=34765 RepID=A0ABN7SRF5_OIKDI|nr:Oidioi.mRNA.OKI2018_I69.chr1.g2580.t1.cds [Oikopleura dioica]